MNKKAITAIENKKLLKEFYNENYDIEEFKGESPYINNYIEMLKEKKK